ncbi:hypothetical protein XELAEV_18003792mg [Xenopus laevis]|uniref:Uncharacterized protein n=1 Tax=Xenopus laevis TaxID=8355 RepID=A0A974BNK9_XENLA|nr:hypothetical protein XELAEV_18003792mg [Xenopus laevis]
MRSTVTDVGLTACWWGREAGGNKGSETMFELDSGSGVEDGVGSWADLIGKVCSARLRRLDFQTLENSYTTVRTRATRQDSIRPGKRENLLTL